ncbi:ankyrin [Piromyces finnis]|uniref:Ankyrin n=1 Tax=Piromyces finnis TaxID=1754191 RepID=A0A1Y1V133_9FUNG|nr:ankyrin [Piromyces finnis]|eukprot:ORX44873.1 ankyrin [Piromyces finnis]
MDFELFESNILNHLKEKNENECLNDIDNNEEVIKNYFNSKKIKYCKNFIDKFNNIVVETYNDFGFSLIEKVLIHDFFSFVLVMFRESDVLVKACAKGNEDAINWLLSMEVNLCIKDEKGMTAMMYVVKIPKLLTYINYFIDNDNILKMTDKDGQTALFHAVNNPEAFKLLIDSGIDINHLNKNNDSILTYCCKNKIYKPIKLILECKNVYLNIYNNDERTAVMYLIEDGRYEELTTLIETQNCVNFDFKNGFGETALSLLIKKYYECYQNENKEEIRSYLEIIKILVEQNVNFNIGIDEEGNTPFMFFMAINDWYTVLLLLMNYKDLDLSIKNKKGMSCSSLCSAIKPEIFKLYSSLNVKSIVNLIMYHKTFDLDYKDNYGNNLAMYFFLYNDYDSSYNLLKRNNRYIKDVNDNKENLIIFSSKLNLRDHIKFLIFSGDQDINQQDYLGNTALHYAVESYNKYIVDLLAFHHANPHIKNKQGKSPLEIANEFPNNEVSELLIQPVYPYAILKNEKSEKRKSIFGIFKKNKILEDDPSIILGKIKNNQYQKEYESQMNIKLSNYTIKSERSVYYGHLQRNAREVYNLFYKSKGRFVMPKDLYEEIFDFQLKMLDVLIDIGNQSGSHYGSNIDGGWDGGWDSSNGDCGGDCGDCGGGGGD